MKEVFFNQKRTCVILYQLCFGYSKGNFFHEDNGLFLKFCNLSQNGIETQRQLGTSISSKEITKIKATIADANFYACNNALEEAINKNFTMLLMIDDYKIRTIDSKMRMPATKWIICAPSSSILKEAPAVAFSSVNLG